MFMSQYAFRVCARLPYLCNLSKMRSPVLEGRVGRSKQIIMNPNPLLMVDGRKELDDRQTWQLGFENRPFHFCPTAPGCGSQLAHLFFFALLLFFLSRLPLSTSPSHAPLLLSLCCPFSLSGDLCC